MGNEITSPAEKDALVKRLMQWERGVKFGDESDIPLDSIALLKLLADCIAHLTAPAEAPVAKVVFDTRWENNVLTYKGNPQIFRLASNDTLMALEPDTPLYAAPLPQSAPVSREAVIEECANVCDRLQAEMRFSSKVSRGNGHEVTANLQHGKADTLNFAAAVIRSLAAHPAEPAGKGA